MINIVHWKDLIGDFLPEFIQIVKAIIAADNSPDREAAKKAIVKSFGEDSYRKALYLLKRLRNCGYEVDGKIIKRYGWLAPYIDSTGDLRFMTTAPSSKRKYISLKEYEAWAEENFHEALETEYYGEELEQIFLSLSDAMGAKR